MLVRLRPVCPRARVSRPASRVPGLGEWNVAELRSRERLQMVRSRSRSGCCSGPERGRSALERSGPERSGPERAGASRRQVESNAASCHG